AAPAVQSEELTRLAILRAFKKHFAGNGTCNRSPFAEDRVVRYHTDVRPLHVPEIHQTVRQAVEENLVRVQRGEPSRVVILAGEPGMGKSHLINYFRSRERADDLGYVLVCNSNHWKVQEFEECLLDWILEALLAPSPHEPHLLLQKVEDISFQALGQILVRPGLVRHFLNRSRTGFFQRILAKSSGTEFSQFQRAAETRDTRIFARLDFPLFAAYVCDRFLETPNNPFHRYVLQVLLYYLFPQEREKVIHWLRRKK